MPFDLGDTWPLTAEVTDPNGLPTNAVTATLTITKPDGSTITPTVTNPPDVTGTYVYDYVPDTPGMYSARWLFTFVGGLTAAYTDALDVRPEPALILSLADAKAHLNITSTDNDEELRSWLESITAVIEHKVGPVVVRTYTARVDGWRWVLPYTPVVALTSITPSLPTGTEVLAADLLVDATSGVVQRLDGANLTGGPWEIVYTAGRPVIPANITHAARIILKHLWETQRGGPRRPTMGGDDGTFDPSFHFSIPRRALELLEPHMLGPGFA